MIEMCLRGFQSLFYLVGTQSPAYTGHAPGQGHPPIFQQLPPQYSMRQMLSPQRPGSGFLQQQQERYGQYQHSSPKRMRIMPNIAPPIAETSPQQHGSHQIPSAINPSPLDMRMLVSQSNMQQRTLNQGQRGSATPQQQTALDMRMLVSQSNMQQQMLHQRQRRSATSEQQTALDMRMLVSQCNMQQRTLNQGQRESATPEQQASISGRMRNEPGAQFPGYLEYAPEQAERPSMFRQQVSSQYPQMQIQQSAQFPEYLAGYAPGQTEHPYAIRPQHSAELLLSQMRGIDPQQMSASHLNPLQTGIPGRRETPSATGHQVYHVGLQGMQRPSHTAYHPQQFGHPVYQQTYEAPPLELAVQAAFSLGFGGSQTVPKAHPDVPRVSRSPQTPPELPEPALVLEGPRIRASWDAPEDSHCLTYCVDIYCNDQLCENMPLRTRNTSVEYPIRPSCRYSCQVWAINSRGVEGRKAWSSCVETCASQQQSCPSVGTAMSSNTQAGTPSQEPTNPGTSAPAVTRSSTTETSSTSSAPGAAGGQHPVSDVTSAVTNVQITRSTFELYTAHLNDDRIYTIKQHRQKGRVLIINNEFLGTKSWREGSEVDVRNMKKLWREMGFDIEKRLNLTAQQMLDFCQQFAQQTKDVSVVVVIVMSHGGKAPDGKEYFVGEDDMRANVDDIVFFFTSNQSRHLRGIPKLFLFQACRGIEIDVVADAETEAPEVQQLAPPPEGPYYQERSDMLITFPTQYGNRALRNTAYGSWHMNAITHVFMQHAHDTHVLDMLTMVNDEVAKKITMDRRIQISNQLHFFRKKLFLFPGWPNR